MEYAGKPVVVARELGELLEYAEGGKALVTLIQERWSDEFLPDVDVVVLRNGDLAAFKRLCAELNLDLVDKRAPSLLLLTESGIQLVLARTEKPEGKAFRRWLVSEVIPAYQATRALPGPASPAPVAARAPKALPGGPLPLPRGVPKEEQAVVDAKNAGLDAYEALDPVVRRRGLVAQDLRRLHRDQARWLVARLAERLALQPPEYRHASPADAEFAPAWEARAQAWWLVQRAPDVEIKEIAGLVTAACTQPRQSTHEMLVEGIVADLDRIPETGVQRLAALIRRLNEERAPADDAIDLLNELVQRGPAAVRQAKQWCDRLWRLEQA